VTTKQEKYATGLGLAFTRSVLGKIGWEISAENRDEGPAFLIKEASND
jgi:K+-sensing histidine kinase KdpD